jgi:hypothetical protein
LRQHLRASQVVSPVTTVLLPGFEGGARTVGMESKRKPSNASKSATVCWHCNNE